MVRRLGELKKPWLTRDELEAVFWRWAGTRNPEAIDEMLRAADAYAVSQGPLLRAGHAERQQRRHLGIVPAMAGDLVPGRFYAPPDASIPDDVITATETVAGAAEAAATRSVPELQDSVIIGAVSQDTETGFVPLELCPERATPVRMGDNGPEQLCSICRDWKRYPEFHRDAIRWNMIASQCKECRNKRQRVRK